jgi:hypothetical protein
MFCRAAFIRTTEARLVAMIQYKRKRRFTRYLSLSDVLPEYEDGFARLSEIPVDYMGSVVLGSRVRMFEYGILYRGKGQLTIHSIWQPSGTSTGNNSPSFFLFYSVDSWKNKIKVS